MFCPPEGLAASSTNFSCPKLNKMAICSIQFTLGFPFRTHVKYSVNTLWVITFGVDCETIDCGRSLNQLAVLKNSLYDTAY